MSSRARQRREAIESKYVAMHSDDTDDMDWEDADFDSLAVYREAESTETNSHRLKSPITSATNREIASDSIVAKRLMQT